MSKNQSKESQTQFAQLEPILEEVVTHEDDEMVKTRMAKKKKRQIIGICVVGLLMTIYILIRMLPSPTPPPVVSPEPTPTPTAPPADTTLQGRIQRARAEVEAIDFYQADLTFPQIEKEIFLDPPDPETVPR